ncbi:MAG: DUF423 domain-containing protein [Flavobacteriales bacterium]|nr:DUF423 domain-containing protein [Flavobacteriales bacterium]
MGNKYFKVGVIFAFTSVILGAFGAHLLKDLLSVDELSSFKTGLRYQMFHALGIIILSLNQDNFTDKLNRVLQIMSFGVILFSFSIYLLSLQNILNIKLSFLGVITPIGGLFLISSWMLLFFIVKKNDSSHI